MNEGRKTAIFAAVAVATLLMAFVTKPRAAKSEKGVLDEMVGKPLFVKDFADPTKAASLEITTYDEGLGTLKPFEIAKDKTTNLWKIPSHDDYPADAAEQVRDAITPLCDLTVQNIATTDRSEHAYYGVVEPDSKKLKIGDSGVGMMINIKNDSGVSVASLIVGKQDAKSEKRRFVRKPNEDPVYVVDLSTTPFSTDFKKWIKGDLLEVKSFDITTIGIRDYAIVRTQGGGSMSRSFDADLTYDPSGSKWNLDKLIGYEAGQTKEIKLADDEELKADKLNDLRNAIQTLEIVDVVRKPKGLAADLKADAALLQNNESLMSLFNQGFIPQKGANDSTEIFATGGETLVGTKDGVQYTLRFGETLTRMTSSETKDEGKTESDNGLQRYLLVTTSLDESKFPLPELKPVPETIEDLLKLEAAEAPAQPPAAPVTTEPAKTDNTTNPPATPESTERPPAPPGAASDERPPAPNANEKPKTNEPAAKPIESTGDKPDNAPATPEKPKSEENSAQPKAKDPSEGCDSPDPATEAAQAEAPKSDAKENSAPAEPAKPADANQPQATDAAKPQESATNAATTPDAPKPDVPSTDVPKLELPNIEPPNAEAPKAETPKAGDKPALTEEELKERLQAARERITKENQRKIDERNAKLDSARKKVQELNAKFSDWYYVVSDSVYKKLKISREEFIGKKTASTTTTPNATGIAPNFQGIPGLPKN